MRLSIDRPARRLWDRVPDGVRSIFWAARYGAPPRWQWLRKVMYADVRETFLKLGPESLDAVEVSGGDWSDLPWRTHRVLSFPAFDLCVPPAGDLPQFDLVICEQVIEHVIDPLTAVATLRRLCRPDGHVLVSTPFLLRLHDHPGDYWRFTPDGMRKLLESQGLEPVWVRSWGNRSVVRRNLGKWALALPWRSLANDPALPIVVWALARPRSAGG